MPKRRATARWTGGVPQGSGTMALGTGSYEGPYSFQSRFEEADGTNPEELIAAAHAGCFSMALSLALTQAGHEPENVETTATVHLDKQDAGFAITRVDLATEAAVSGLSDEDFQGYAEAAKDGCPVSRALAALEITVDAKLRG